jgi:hypothetical protein
MDKCASRKTERQRAHSFIEFFKIIVRFMVYVQGADYKIMMQ